LRLIHQTVYLEICIGVPWYVEVYKFIFVGLKTCMKEGYSFIDGMEELLQDLKQNNYEMHAFTNYPSW